MLACMGFLVWLATKAPRTGLLTGTASFRLKPIAWGVASFPALFIVPVLLSGAKVNLVLFYGYLAVAITLIVRWLGRRPTIPLITCLLFAIGDDLLMVVWARRRLLRPPVPCRHWETPSLRLEVRHTGLGSQRQTCWLA
jgi:hypothetical protein